MQGGKIDVPDLGKFGPEGSFSREEVQLANRNRGMPLEALRYPITPTGLHYLLTHFDIPYIDATSWNLSIDGLVSNPTTLTLDDVKAMPRVTTAVTMECAGNGRALMSPRAVSQPWHLEAIGTAEWTGTPLKGVLREAGIRNTAVEVLFTGLDRGLEAGEFSYYQRSLSIEEASRDEALLAYEMNGSPLEPQHGHPLRLVVPGWYGMTSVKWLGSIEAIGEPFNGFQPTFPRSAAWVRRNPVRVLPILAAYMVGMGSVCARLAEIAGFGSGYRNLAGGTQWVKAPTPL